MTQWTLHYSTFIQSSITLDSPHTMSRKQAINLHFSICLYFYVPYCCCCSNTSEPTIFPIIVYCQTLPHTIHKAPLFISLDSSSFQCSFPYIFFYSRHFLQTKTHKGGLRVSVSFSLLNTSYICAILVAIVNYWISSIYATRFSTSLRITTTPGTKAKIIQSLL